MPLTTETAPAPARAALGPVALQFWVDLVNAQEAAGVGPNVAMYRAWESLWMAGFVRTPSGEYVRAENYVEQAARMEAWYAPPDGSVKASEGDGAAAVEVHAAGKVLSKENANALLGVLGSMRRGASELADFLKGCGYGETEDVEESVPAASVEDRMVATVRKSATDQRLVSGWASMSTDAKGRAVVDSQGWTVPVETLRPAIHKHIRHGSRAGNDEHGPDQLMELVEAVIIDQDVRVSLGLPAVGETGLWVTYQVNDTALWAEVQAGRKMCFSIEGEGILVG